MYFFYRKTVFDSKTQHYAEDPDDSLVESSIRAIGYCARIVPECTQQALNAMMTFIQSKHGWSTSFESIINQTLNVFLRCHCYEYCSGSEIPGTAAISGF